MALNAATGELVWHFQTVHHDLWEYDLAGPPTLGEITVDGRRIRAVMQPGKTGFLYVFDRATGEPVWPIEERPVPQSTVPGEHTSPTQPFPTKPAPFDRQGVTEDDLIDFTPELRARALQLVADSFSIGPLFTPPALSRDQGGPGGTLLVPGSWGAGNWNTGAFDPETGIYYVVSHTLARVYRLERATERDAEMEYWSRTRDAPTLEGLPIIKPPYGRVTAIDLNRGEHVWTVANGRQRRWVPGSSASEGARPSPARDRQPSGRAGHRVASLPRRRLGRFRWHGRLGTDVPGLRHCNGSGAVGDRASRGYHRRSDDLSPSG